MNLLSWEDSLEKGMSTGSSTLARRIPRTEEPGRGTRHRLLETMATGLSGPRSQLGSFAGNISWSQRNNGLLTISI